MTKIWDKTDLGNGLLPGSTKPLPEPMLTDHKIHLQKESGPAVTGSIVVGSAVWGSASAVAGLAGIFDSEPAPQRRHTWFEPMGDPLEAGDHHLTLE